MESPIKDNGPLHLLISHGRRFSYLEANPEHSFRLFTEIRQFIQLFAHQLIDLPKITSSLLHPSLIMIFILSRPQDILPPHSPSVQKPNKQPNHHQNYRHRTPDPQNALTHNRPPNFNRSNRKSYIRKYKSPPYKMKTHPLFPERSSQYTH